MLIRISTVIWLSASTGVTYCVDFWKTQFDPGITYVRPKTLFIHAASKDIITFGCQIAIIVKSELLAFC